MDSVLKNKNILLPVTVILLVIIIGMGALVLRSKSSQRAQDQTEDVLPDDAENLPPVESSVTVDLKPDSKKQNVTLTISNIPKAYTSIEYELVYEHDLSKRDIAEGAEGTRKVDAAFDTIEVTSSTVSHEIKLGTCSATCTYHTGITSIKAKLKFISPDGAKGYSKDFSI